MPQRTFRLAGDVPDVLVRTVYPALTHDDMPTTEPYLEVVVLDLQTNQYLLVSASHLFPPPGLMALPVALPPPGVVPAAGGEIQLKTE